VQRRGPFFCGPLFTTGAEDKPGSCFFDIHHHYRLTMDDAVIGNAVFPRPLPFRRLFLCSRLFRSVQAVVVDIAFHD
jgi:hypothetical protein